MSPSPVNVWPSTPARSMPAVAAFAGGHFLRRLVIQPAVEVMVVAFADRDVNHFVNRVGKGQCKPGFRSCALPTPTAGRSQNDSDLIRFDGENAGRDDTMTSTASAVLTMRKLLGALAAARHALDPKAPEFGGAPEPARGVEDAARRRCPGAPEQFPHRQTADGGAGHCVHRVLRFHRQTESGRYRSAIRPAGRVGRAQLLKPGLHWAFPYRLDEVVYVPVGESHTITSTAAGITRRRRKWPPGKSRNRWACCGGRGRHTLTGDGDIIHARATLSYRVIDPVSYVFNFANVTNLLEHILDNALFYASAPFHRG